MVVYINDILIHSANVNEHLTHVQEVLKCLQQHHLFTNLWKCTWNTDHIEFLGYIISSTGVQMDPGKVMAITQWATPHNVHDIQVFHGFANFYCCFIKGFSNICKPLNALLQKHMPWTWGVNQQKVFDTLQEVFTTAPIL